MSDRRSIPGLVGLGIRRVIGRLTGPTPGRTVVCLVGVAVAIAVLVVVTGLSLGLAGTATVEGDDVNYWIVPEESDVGSTPFAYEGTQLSDVHGMSEELSHDDRISSATPVAIQLVRLDAVQTTESAHVMAIGVIPTGGDRVAGIDISALDRTYPYYNEGSYDGEWTGELVASPAAADQLALSEGHRLTIQDADRQFEVVGLADENPQTGVGEIPVVIVHLAELQSVTGLGETDQANQIQVATTDSDVRKDIEEKYPETSVVTRSGFSGVQAEPTNLPFAMAVAAGLTALGIGVIFVTTMMGLELTATRQQLAVLNAVGFRYSSVALLVVIETLTIAVLGGLVGVALGLGAILGLNAGLASTFDLPMIAVIEPSLIGYGIGTATLVGILSVSYPLYITYRTGTLEELTG